VAGCAATTPRDSNEVNAITPATTKPIVALAAFQRHPSMAASLRMELDVLVPEHRLLVVTGQGASVTEVAAGLAIAEGAAGRTSVLVAGLSLGEQAPGWGALTEGLAEWLLADGGSGDPISATDVERVSFVPRGAAVEVARLRLDGGAVVRFRDETLARFDRIVWCVDGVKGLGELAVVARVADAVLFVAERGRTERESAERMRRVVDDAGARVAGVVSVGRSERG
jgi:Mrp family chromosome partitioning ATPase